MQRLFCVKLLSKITTNGSSSSVASSSIVLEPLFPSTLLKMKANPVFHQSSAPYSAVSRSHLWNFCGYNGVSGSSRHGFFLNPALARRTFSNALSKGQTKFAVGVTVRNQGRRNFHSPDSSNRGGRSHVSRLTVVGVVLGLVAANAAIFVLWKVASPQFMVENFMISVDNFTSGRVHTLITAAFSHRDVRDLVIKMLELCFFGLGIGSAYGPEYLLKLYLSGALVGSIFYLGYHAFIAPKFQQKPGVHPSKIPGLGASGAVNAVVLLNIFLCPTRTILLDFIIPVPAALIGIYVVARDVLNALEGKLYVSASNSLGGVVVAALAWAEIRKRRFGRF